MNVEHSARFSRDLRQIPSAQLRRRLALKIEELEEASNIIEVSGVKRLRAEGRHYRIRIGMALLLGNHISIDARVGGEVLIEPA